ncbi:MAG: DUF1801 domain-containing protein [Leucobacter sp.]
MAQMTPKQAEKAAAEAAKLVEKIESWPEPFRGIGLRVHEVISSNAPELRAKIWYGMPGYNLGGPTLLFFRYDADYFTLGLSEHVQLEVEEGAGDRLMPCAWYLTSLDEATEQRIAQIARIAAG